MLFTIKELAHRFQMDEIAVRTVINVFEIPARGTGVKPPRGRSPGTYKEEDLKRAFEIVKQAKEEFARTT